MNLKNITVLLVTMLMIAPIWSYQLEGVTIYQRSDQQGSAVTLLDRTVSGDDIPNNLNNSVSSLLIARGWRVKLASNADGSGRVQVYTATNNELKINLPQDLNNSISYFKSQPLWGARIYRNTNLSGNSVQLKAGIYSGSDIPGNLNDAIASIRILPGHMVTLAEFSNGTGYSVNYISRTENLDINVPDQLRNKISYLRIEPWRDVRKKGLAQTLKNDGDRLAVRMNTDWWYNWNTNAATTRDYEYVPMHDAAPRAESIENISTMPNILHVNLFNEPDDTKPEGQPNDMTPSEAVGYHKQFLKTGLRIGSPAPKEGGAFRWLCEYMTGVKANRHRVDYINLHWYDWAGWRRFQDPDANANDVFERFKSYLNRIHDLYGLPIWITEFNANKNRLPRVQREFLRLALPWLDRQDFIERYSYFICTDNCEFLNEDGTLTATGRIYRDHQSTWSIPESKWSGPSLNNVSRPTCTGSNANAKNSDITSFTYQITPNPIRDQVNVEGLQYNTVLEVYDISGKKMLQGYGQSLDVSNLASGVYFLKFEGQMLKFLK